MFVSDLNHGRLAARETVVENCIDGFRRSDHGQVLSCLDDEVVWEICGHATVRFTDDAISGLESAK